MKIMLKHPKNQWAKNRLREHGNIFEINNSELDTRLFNGDVAVFVWCTCEKHVDNQWFGWFTDKDVEWETVDE